MYILFSTNFSRKSCMPNCKNVLSSLKSRILGSYMIFNNGFSLDQKKIQIVAIIIIWQTPFLVWDVSCFLGFYKNCCSFDTTYKQWQIQMEYCRCCKRFQIFKECFHDNSHFNSCKPIKAILSWSKCFKVCSWCCVILVCKWWTTTSCWIPFKKVLSDQNKLWNSWQKIFGYPS